MKFKPGLKMLILSALAVTFFGCAMFQETEEKTARELAETGMEAMRDGDYKAAAEAFQKLRDFYPFSQYAILAELKLGDAHYHRDEYEDAIFAYEEFENLHPKNEAVPYVIYQIGRCYFDRRQSADRDQTMANEAVRTFERLINSYPDSPFSKQAREHVWVCKRSLAEHEFYVGQYYYKKKHYKAALERFKTVLTAYPDLGIHYKAIEYLALCRNEIQKQSSVAE